MEFVITRSKSKSKTEPGIVIRRNGLYINRVSCEAALETFLAANLPTGIFKKIDERYKLTDKISKANGAWDVDGNHIPLNKLAYGLGFTFTRE